MVCEVALTVVLLAASGLLIRTLIHLQTLPAGFNPTGVIAAKASLDDARYRDPAAFRKLLQESTAAVRQIPGVQHAAVGLSLPYERSLILGALSISDGREAGQRVTTDETYVTPGYFQALEIPAWPGAPSPTRTAPIRSAWPSSTGPSCANFSTEQIRSAVTRIRTR